jgi:hypothetical protein
MMVTVILPAHLLGFLFTRDVGFRVSFCSGLTSIDSDFKYTGTIEATIHKK